jgi:hypothetical protein
MMLNAGITKLSFHLNAARLAEGIFEYVYYEKGVSDDADDYDDDDEKCDKGDKTVMKTPSGREISLNTNFDFVRFKFFLFFMVIKLRIVIKKGLIQSLMFYLTF